MEKIAIHGFGRIGRTALRRALEQGSFVPAAVSDIRDSATQGAQSHLDRGAKRVLVLIRPRVPTAMAAWSQNDATLE
jgi:glutamate dehydrogenase/leucine dehydrogenase